MSGTLYVCATPIGNLEDITLRALRVLREVDAIIAEDTRRTRVLLQHHGIATPLWSSLHQGSEERRLGSVLERLAAGHDLALVSDAGTPLISDPGYPLVRACVDCGIRVVPVPGPSSILAALSGSGLPTDRFVFLGAAPRKTGARAQLMEELAEIRCTAVLLESPHRVLRTLGTLAERHPDRPVVVARELTKMHEEFLHGTAAEVHAELAGRDRIRGEFVLLIGTGGEPVRSEADQGSEIYAQLLAQGKPPREALREAARIAGISRREAYQQVHRT